MQHLSQYFGGHTARYPIKLEEYPALGTVLDSISMYESVSLKRLSHIIPERDEVEIAAALVAATGSQLAIKYFSEENEPLLKLSGLRSENFGLDSYNEGSFLYDVDKDPCFPLWEAVVSEDDRAVNKLVKSTSDINGITLRYRRSCSTPLIAAVFHDSVRMISSLLEAEADVNCCDGLGNSPLIVSSAKSVSVQVTRQLIEAGAEIDAQGQYGCTVLSGLSNIEKLSMLLEAGANPNIQNESRATPLFTAARDGEKDVVRLLLRHGADPNLTLDSGYSPLMWAAARGYAGMVRELIGAGADINARTTDGKIALDEANGNEEITTILRSKATP